LRHPPVKQCWHSDLSLKLHHLTFKPQKIADLKVFKRWLIKESIGSSPDLHHILKQTTRNKQELIPGIDKTLIRNKLVRKYLGFLEHNKWPAVVLTDGADPKNGLKEDRGFPVDHGCARLQELPHRHATISLLTSCTARSSHTTEV
jgi:hypothetical protein